MRSYRKLALALVILYSVFAIGIHLHSHRGADLVNPDCKLCQASHLSLIQTPETHCTQEKVVISAASQATQSFVLFAKKEGVSGRAPPTV